MSKLTLALCQTAVTADKEKNILNAEDDIAKAARMGADLAVLPEMFNCPYENSWFLKFAEPEGGSTYTRLSKLARKSGIILVGGSIPEVDDEGKIYNTSYSFNPRGELIGKHRKAHLFDIDIKGGQKFRESDTLSPGEKVTVIDTEFGKIGVAICFDIRFPELFRAMTLAGARLIIVPAAFNMTTGPAHWELTFRMRAVDNQVFMAGAAPARDESASYISYGNSIITNPWGEVISRLGPEEGILFQEINLEEVEEIREQLPLISSLKRELYPLPEDIFKSPGKVRPGLRTFRRI
ncbi:MAG: carbon-nitrogen hydrolase family protein [Spirochaetales bacterium]|nr:carbon-nitrogen hydrolase family protein [Spirochaetales bacterium]